MATSTSGRPLKKSTEKIEGLKFIKEKKIPQFKNGTKIYIKNAQNVKIEMIHNHEKILEPNQ